MNSIRPTPAHAFAFYAKLIAIACLLAIGAAATVRAADIISFSVASPKNTSQNFMRGVDFAGAPGARTNNWNNLLASADGSAANITMADGSVSNSAGNIVGGLAVTFHPGGTGGGVFNRGNGVTNDTRMFMDVEDMYGANSFSGYGYIDITNIPYASYNVYCYFLPDNGNGTANTRGGFWLITNTPTGSQRYYIRNQSNDVAQTVVATPNTSGGNYLQTTTTALAPGANTWSAISPGNYAVFSNLTNSWTRIWFGGLGNGNGSGGSAGADDLGNYVTGGSAAVRFKNAGFQIVQVPSGVATRIYLQSSNLTLHAGNPVGTQGTVLADLDTGATGVDKTTASGKPKPTEANTNCGFVCAAWHKSSNLEVAIIAA
jgi:prepilin-type processing-associated H-X9-DG protein